MKSLICRVTYSENIVYTSVIIITAAAISQCWLLDPIIFICQMFSVALLIPINQFLNADPKVRFWENWKETKKQPHFGFVAFFIVCLCPTGRKKKSRNHKIYLQAVKINYTTLSSTEVAL